MINHLPSMCKALGLILRVAKAKKKKKKNTVMTAPSAGEMLCDFDWCLLYSQHTLNLKLRTTALDGNTYLLPNLQAARKHATFHASPLLSSLAVFFLAFYWRFCWPFLGPSPGKSLVIIFSGTSDHTIGPGAIT
jgi:hypothetical protein